MMRHVHLLAFITVSTFVAFRSAEAQPALKAEVKADAKADEKGAAGAAGADVLGDATKPAAEGDPTAGAQSAPGAGAGVAARRYEDIVVVPRKEVIKAGRVELAPYSGISINDVLIRHYVFGAHLNYFLTDVFSVGIEGQYFIKQRSERESLVGLQYNRVPALNKFKYAAALNFGYAPGYGKFAIFNKYIWHWEVLANAGVGVIWTEIIPRVVGDEAFGGMRIAPNFGTGARLFLNDWITLSAHLRYQVFNDRYEPSGRGDRGWTVEQAEQNAESRFVHNVTVGLSVGFFLPPSFQYKTPR